MKHPTQQMTVSSIHYNFTIDLTPINIQETLHSVLYVTKSDSHIYFNYIVKNLPVISFAKLLSFDPDNKLQDDKYYKIRAITRIES